MPFSPVITIDETKDEPLAYRDSGLISKSIRERLNRRRLAAYQTKIWGGWQGPRLIAEGDSWFHYPILLSDVVDNLSAKYAVYTAATTGDPLENLVRGLSSPETLIEREKFQGLLLSVGGNDIMGRPLRTYLAAQPPPERPAADYIEGSYGVFLRNTRTRLDGVFTRLTVRFPDLKIICHGYDWLLPRTDGLWLQPALASQELPGDAVQSAVLRLIIDRYYDMLAGLADKYRQRVFVADCRGAVGERGEWFDELHPRNPGFARVAARLQAVIDDAFGMSKAPSTQQTGARISWYESTRRGADARTATFPIGSRVTIGRDSDNAITLDNRRVSRKHVRLEIGAEGVALTDLNTTNGTRLDGRRRLGTTPWREGQILEIGDYSLQFVFVREAPARVSSVPDELRAETSSAPQREVAPIGQAGEVSVRPPREPVEVPQDWAPARPQVPVGIAKYGASVPEGSPPALGEKLPEGARQGPLPSGILVRILDDRGLDYLWLAAFAAAH